MSKFLPLSTKGDALRIEHGTAGVSVYVHDETSFTVLVIANEDVPAVAAELLKAAGQESVIVAKAYEEVERLGDELTCGGGPEWVGASIAANPNWLRNKAANCIAIAEYIENRASREAEAEKKLQERQDELAREYHALPYALLGGGSQRFIDAYIELEDGK